MKDYKILIIKTTKDYDNDVYNIGDNLGGKSSVFMTCDSIEEGLQAITKDLKVFQEYIRMKGEFELCKGGKKLLTKVMNNINQNKLIKFSLTDTMIGWQDLTLIAKFFTDETWIEGYAGANKWEYWGIKIPKI